MNDLTWKVMVFFAGQRLAEHMVYSLKEMKSVGSSEGLTLLAQYSTKWIWRRRSSPTDPATPLRFKFSDDPKEVDKWVIRDYQRPLTTARPFPEYVGELVDFIRWGINEPPVAKRNMVILSGDGGGPLANFLPSLVADRKIKPFELHQVFKEVHKDRKKKIDVVGLDSCLMSTAEIGYELRPYVNFLISSQGNEDDIGWPYRDFLTRFRQKLRRAKGKRPFDSRDVAELAVDRYNSYFVDYAMIAKTSANLSALNLAQFDRLASAVAGFVNAAKRILPPEPKDAGDIAQTDRQTKTNERRDVFARILVRAHWVSQTYRDEQYADLYDFAANLIEEIEKFGLGNDERFNKVAAACRDIKAVICSKENDCGSAANDLVVKSCYVGSKYQYSKGLSIYFPWNNIREEYFPYLRYNRTQQPADFFQHSFPRETGWDQFLKRYLHWTRRSPRVGFDIGLIDPKYLELFKHRDPPEGRGAAYLGDSGQNPPLVWAIPDCVPDPSGFL
jgi:hypothetical protein